MIYQQKTPLLPVVASPQPPNLRFGSAAGQIIDLYNIYNKEAVINGIFITDNR